MLVREINRAVQDNLKLLKTHVLHTRMRIVDSLLIIFPVCAAFWVSYCHGCLVKVVQTYERSTRHQINLYRQTPALENSNAFCGWVNIFVAIRRCPYKRFLKFRDISKDDPSISVGLLKLRSFMHANSFLGNQLLLSQIADYLLLYSGFSYFVQWHLKKIISKYNILWYMKNDLI